MKNLLTSEKGGLKKTRVKQILGGRNSGGLVNCHGRVKKRGAKKRYNRTIPRFRGG